MANYLEYKKSQREIERMTWEQLKQDKDWCLHAANQNTAHYQELIEAKKVMLSAAAQIWGYRSKQHKYIQTHNVPKPPNMNSAYAKVRQKFMAVQSARERQEKRREYQKNYSRRRQEAADWLTAQGYVLGEDFGLNNAISYRKQVEAGIEAIPEVFGVLPTDVQSVMGEADHANGS